MSIRIHIFLCHPSSTGIEFITLILDKHVIHEPTAHYLEPLVDILDSKLHMYINQLPNEKSMMLLPSLSPCLSL
jgi:hypothetical protein